jgi:hypothetical protein
MIKRKAAPWATPEDQAATPGPRPAVRCQHGLGPEYEQQIRRQVHGRFMEIDILVEQGYSLLQAARKVGLPFDTWWVLTGGRRREIFTVFWQKSGRDYRGDAHRISATHFSENGRQTLCGLPIPDERTHNLTWDQPAGRDPCKGCYDTLRKIKGGRRV